MVAQPAPQLFMRGAFLFTLSERSESKGLR